MQDGVPYAIDFLNPAPDFERDRITEFYFEQVVERMARLVIDRALNGDASNPWPRWEEMVGIKTGDQEAAAGFTGAPKLKTQAAAAQSQTAPAQTAQKSSASGIAANSVCAEPARSLHRTPPPAARANENKMSTASPKPTDGNPAEYWHALLHPALSTITPSRRISAELRAAKLTFGDRVHCPFLRPFFLSPQDEERVRPVAETIAELGERVAMRRWRTKNFSRNFICAPRKRGWRVCPAETEESARRRGWMRFCCRNR